MNSSREAGTISFQDLEGVLFPDSCIPLAAAADAGLVKLDALARGHYPGEPLSDGSIEGVRTLGYWDASLAQDWGLDWHRNEGIELTYVEKGGTHFAVEDHEWELQAGDVTVTRPWQRHRVGDPNIGASALHWVIIDVGVRRPNQAWHWPEWIGLAPADIERLTYLLQHNEQAVWRAGTALGEAFVETTALVGGSGPGRESALRLGISNMLLELLKTLELQDMQLDHSLTAPRRGVRIFLEDLRGRLDYKWTLPEMAASCAMGRTQFTRHCQEITNMTPIEYLTHSRIERAKEMLRTTGRSVTDIATMCGFETSQYFATRFRTAVGTSPASYRKLHGVAGTETEAAADLAVVA